MKKSLGEVLRDALPGILRPEDYEAAAREVVIAYEERRVPAYRLDATTDDLLRAKLRALVKEWRGKREPMLAKLVSHKGETEYALTMGIVSQREVCADGLEALLGGEDE